jgi:hypothetical protein
MSNTDDHRFEEMVGLNRNQVREVLGGPDAVGGTSRRYRVPRVWKYGSVELYFGTDGVVTSVFHDPESSGTSRRHENGLY